PGRTSSGTCSWARGTPRGAARSSSPTASASCWCKPLVLPTPVLRHGASCTMTYKVTLTGPGRTAPRSGGPSVTCFRRAFGNPFPAVGLGRAVLAWHGGAVIKLAQAVDEDRELPSGALGAARLGVPGDKLGEAGWRDAFLLGPPRGPGPHVRGCFAVDALV